MFLKIASDAFSFIFFKLVFNFNIILHPQYLALGWAHICFSRRCQIRPIGTSTRLEQLLTSCILGVKEYRIGPVNTFSIKLLTDYMKNIYCYLSYENHWLFTVCFHPWSCQTLAKTHWLYASHSFSETYNLAKFGWIFIGVSKGTLLASVAKLKQP